MPDTAESFAKASDWNVLTSRWLEVMTLDAEAKVMSPLEALEGGRNLRCIALASPLDLFAAHRFLLTLLYWKADASGGVKQLREALLRGNMPRTVLDSIENESRRFRLFDDKYPFLQDPSAPDDKRKSAGSLSAEFASGTNIAHFHHGDDEKMRLCPRCATIGMLRVVPWTQSGGAGLTPSVHNAPPIMALASGGNLAVTLGLNLVLLSAPKGEAKWTGWFTPTDKNRPIPYLEALTWNPRRIRLLQAQGPQQCWMCGRDQIDAVGPIVYLKNENTTTKKKEDKKSIPFTWRDPSAFYADESFRAIKSLGENRAASRDDLRRLKDQDDAPKTLVVEMNLNHEGWHLIIPCTDSKMKTFDHRQLDVASLAPDEIAKWLPADAPAPEHDGLDGWADPPRATHAEGAKRFVQSAARLFTHADWVALSNASYMDMHDSPEAFDLLSGLYWGLRKPVSGLPSRNVAWLVLKLMATVPARARAPHANAAYCPLRSLPKRQLERRGNRPVASPYPVSFPRGNRLEAELRRAIDKNLRRRSPEHIDWIGLCHGLDQMLD